MWYLASKLEWGKEGVHWQQKSLLKTLCGVKNESSAPFPSLTHTNCLCHKHKLFHPSLLSTILPLPAAGTYCHNVLLPYAIRTYWQPLKSIGWFQISECLNVWKSWRHSSSAFFERLPCSWWQRRDLTNQNVCGYASRARNIEWLRFRTIGCVSLDTLQPPLVLASFF